MDLKKLIESAPDGATHVTIKGSWVRYFKWDKLDSYLTYTKHNDWSDMYRPTEFIRSIGDIKENIELKEKLGLVT